MLLVEEEGTASTFQALGEVIDERGLFCALYTDRGSHYFYTPKAGEKVSKTQQTQVGRALSHLGIEHIAAYSPQARGRSERMFGTLQGRLPKRLAGIRTVEAEQPGTAFVADRHQAWREALCVIEERTVANDNTIAWSGRRLQLPESRLRPHFVKAVVRVHEYPDGSVSVFLGPHRLATFTADGQQLSPDAPQPGSVLGAVKDKPLRARLDRPARAAVETARVGTEKRASSRTKKPTRRANPAANIHGMTTSAEPSTPSGSSATQQRRRQITSYKNTTFSPATDIRRNSIEHGANVIVTWDTLGMRLISNNVSQFERPHPGPSASRR